MNAPARKVAVLGGSGLIGSHVVDQLCALKAEVIATHRDRVPHRQASGLTWLKRDLRTEGAAEAVRGVDSVIMAAGEVLTAARLKTEGWEAIERLVNLGFWVIKACQNEGVKNLVWVSSTAGYPERQGVMKEADFFESDPPESQSKLGWASRYVEKAVLSLGFGRSDLSTVIVRPSLVYGERGEFRPDRAHFIGKALYLAAKGEKEISVFGDGNDRRDYIHAEDVARGIVAALMRAKEAGKPETGQAYHLVSGKLWSLREVVQTLSEFAPQGLRLVSGASAVSKTAERSFSTDHALHLLGFQPTIGLREGLSRTLRWLEKNQ